MLTHTRLLFYSIQCAPDKDVLWVNWFVLFGVALWSDSFFYLFLIFPAVLLYYAGNFICGSCRRKIGL
jgi:hypothetical protein